LIMPQSIRPFRLAVTDAAISELHARLDHVRWPDQVNDESWSYGMQREYLRELIRFWRNEFDWRKAEARINAFDQYMLDIDGLDIHFIHQRSPHPEATPLLITHGWPGSIVEFLDVIPMLTEPERFGGDSKDAFHVICPSLPGYGCSSAATTAGMHPGAIARRHARLMQSLGYERYLAQGGDWGSPITQLLAGQDSEHCRAIHLNIMTATPPKEIADPMTLVKAHEKAWLESNLRHQQESMGYYHIQTTRPQTLAYALADSPVGLCAWIAEKFYFWSDCERDGKRDIRNAISWDALLTNVSLYWHTNTIASSVRLYRELLLALVDGALAIPFEVPVPVGVAIYPQELVKIPRARAERNVNLIHWHEAEQGGHFAAMEQPAAFVNDLRRFKQRAEAYL
jgi:microsomal epoxide hydrolase